MASLNEILNTRIAEGNTVPDSVWNIIRDTMSAPTNERYTNQALERLGDVPAWISGEGVEVVQDPTLPSLAKFFTTAGITDDKAKAEGKKDAKELFIEGYAKHRKGWEKKIKADPVLGSQGVKTFNELWKRAVYDQAEQEKKEFLANLGDAPSNYGLFTANVPGSKFVTELLFPRSTEHLYNTGDIDTKDVLLDLGENAAMSVPGAGWTKAGGIVARKAAPSLVLKAAQEAEKLAASNSRIAQGVPKAVKALRNTSTNAIVPVATEVADDIAYDPGEGMDDRSNFDIGDVAVGTAINQGVQRGILRDMMPALTRYGSVRDSENRAAKRGLREFFATLGQSRRQLGDDLITGARDVVKSPVVRAFPEGTQVTEGELRGLTNGVNIIPEGVTVDEYLNNLRIANVADMIDRGELRFKNWKDISSILNENKNDKKFVEDLIKGKQNLAGEKYRESMKKGLSGAERERLRAEANQLGHDADNLVSLMGDDKITAGLTPREIIAGVGPMRHGTPGGEVARNVPVSSIIKDVFNKNPELYNYAFWKNAPLSAKIENAVHQAWPSLATNKAGKSSYASDILRVTKPITEENRKESREESKKVQASRILDTRAENLSENDKRWLREIAKNPDIVKEGFTKGSLKDADDFKVWLLLGGNDLLRGTDLARPMWEIQ